MTPFKPSWWCRGPHAQTLWASLKPRRAPQSRTERLELPDGDFLDLTWTGKDCGPIVVVMHGLAGSAHSPYAKGILHAIDRAGWRGCLMHFRGCSGEPNRLNRSYHSGETGDIRHLIQTLTHRHPDTPLALVGYSIGGNALLKYMGEEGDRCGVNAAVAVSVPFELEQTCEHMERGLARMYQWNLVKQLRTEVAKKMKRQDLGLGLDAQALNRLRTFRTFDDKVTAPLHGYQNARDYYTQCSSRQFLVAIQRPTLLLQSRDDPFMNAAVIPTEAEMSEMVHLELSDRGGHVGFIQGPPWRTRYWLEERIPAFLQKHLC